VTPGDVRHTGVAPTNQKMADTRVAQRGVMSVLVSAGNDGTVGYCGYTAPATDELRANFDIAFPDS
jgi:hypothetical protein